MNKIAFLENRDGDDLLDEEAKEENFINDIATTELYNLKVETIPVTVNKEMIIQQNSESSLTSLGTVLLVKAQALVILSGLKCITFPENHNDEVLLEEKAPEENLINDMTTTELFNLKVETITKRGSDEQIIQQNTESSITSMGNVSYLKKFKHIGYSIWYQIVKNCFSRKSR